MSDAEFILSICKETMRTRRSDLREASSHRNTLTQKFFKIFFISFLLHEMFMSSSEKEASCIWLNIWSSEQVRCNRKFCIQITTSSPQTFPNPAIVVQQQLVVRQHHLRVILLVCLRFSLAKLRCFSLVAKGEKFLHIFQLTTSLYVIYLMDLYASILFTSFSLENNPAAWVKSFTTFSAVYRLKSTSLFPPQLRLHSQRSLAWKVV